MLDGFLRENSKDLGKIQIIFDPLIITYLFSLSYTPSTNFSGYQNIQFIVFILTYVFLSTGALYKSYRDKSILRIVLSVVKIWLFLFLFFLAIDYLFLGSIFLGSFLKWSTLSLFFLLIDHAGLRLIFRFLRKNGRNSRNYIFWGPFESLNSLKIETKSNLWLGLENIAWFSNDKCYSIDEEDDIYSDGGIEEMKIWLANNETDYIIFSENNLTRINELLKIFGDTSYPVYYYPDFDNSYLNLKKINIGSKTILEIWSDQKTYLDLKIKRMFDLIFSILILIFLSPILILTIIALSIEKPGKVFYKQSRYGLNGKKFMLIKFRSMNIMEESDDKFLKHTSEDDKRVTPLGRILRRWSIDELPQLINVIEGTMSLVGPRPHAINHNEYYRKLIPGYMQRHSGKPGMTGLAQVEGWRGDIKTLNDMRKRVEADLRYHENWSIYLDFKILLRTFFSLKGV